MVQVTYLQRFEELKLRVRNLTEQNQLRCDEVCELRRQGIIEKNELYSEVEDRLAREKGVISAMLENTAADIKAQLHAGNEEMTKHLAGCAQKAEVRAEMESVCGMLFEKYLGPRAGREGSPFKIRKVTEVCNIPCPLLTVWDRPPLASSQVPWTPSKDVAASLTVLFGRVARVRSALLDNLSDIPVLEGIRLWPVASHRLYGGGQVGLVSARLIALHLACDITPGDVHTDRRSCATTRFRVR